MLGIRAILVWRLQAEKIMIDLEENKEYLPIQGLEAFNKATADLLLGQGHPVTKVSASPGAPALSSLGMQDMQHRARHPGNLLLGQLHQVTSSSCTTCIACRHVSSCLIQQPLPLHLKPFAVVLSPHGLTARCHLLCLPVAKCYELSSFGEASSHTAVPLWNRSPQGCSSNNRSAPATLQGTCRPRCSGYICLSA